MRLQFNILMASHTDTDIAVCIAFPAISPPKLVTLTSCSVGSDDQITGLRPIQLWHTHVPSLIFRRKPDLIPGQWLRFQNHVLKRFYFTLGPVRAISGWYIVPGITQTSRTFLLRDIQILFTPRHSTLCHDVDCVSHI